MVLTEKGLFHADRTSVIVRSRNEEATVGRTLGLIAAQAAAPLEVILLDNSSTDNTVGIAKELGCRVVNISDKTPYNHAQACNTGIDEARGEFVVLTNAHTFPVSSSDWLESGTKHFRDEQVAGCSGEVYLDERGTVWEKRRAAFFRKPGSSQPRVHRDISLFGSMDIFQTIIGSMRKELWRSRPFDEGYANRYGGGEDIDWAFYFVQKGYDFVTDPGFSVYHSHGENLQKMLISQGTYALYYLGAYIRYRVKGLRSNR